MAEDFATRYLVGTLGASREAAYEEHLLECPRCQEEVRFAAAVRSALNASAPIRDTTGKAALSPARGSRPSRAPVLWAAAATAAALLAVAVLVPRDGSDRLAELGTVAQAPLYLGVEVRAAEGNGVLTFDRAMGHYATGDWHAAVDALESARAAGSDPVPTHFFLGASLLMLDRSRDAASAFERVIEAGQSPYLGEARYYRAKALLRLGRLDEALADLRVLAASSHELAPDAAQLAAQAEEVVRR